LWYDASQYVKKCALGSNCAPNARAETGGAGTGPRPATPKPTEPSGPMGDARAGHCIHPDLSRGGNAAAQLNRVRNKRSTSRINSAVAYPKANRDFSAMATGSHGDHAPVSVELGRNCGRSGIENCESGRQSEGAHTIANHGSPHTCVVMVRAATGFTSCKELAGYGSLKGGIEWASS